VDPRYGFSTASAKQHAGKCTECGKHMQRCDHAARLRDKCTLYEQQHVAATDAWTAHRATKH